jgi:hypothetical protein
MKHSPIHIAVIALALIIGCSKPPEPKEKKAEAGTSSKAGADIYDREVEPPPPPPEGRAVLAFKDGQVAKMTEPQALAKGLTIIDLSNFWVPFIFSETDGPESERLPNEFRPIFRKLANDWPYESRTMSAARVLVERSIERARAAKILELREQGVSEEEIKELWGLEDPENKEAKEEPDAGEEEDAFEGGLGDAEHFLEVFGIPPSLSVLRKRALEEVGRKCFSDVDFEAIKRFDGFVAYNNNDTAEAEAKKGRTFSVKMRREMERLGVADPLELVDRKDAKASAGLMRIAFRFEAMIEAQKQLACEGMFHPGAEKTYRKGGLDWRTHLALVAFEHKNRIFGWGFFGRETLEALGRTPTERLYDTFLRVLAERIADAAGVVEDGSAKESRAAAATYKDEKGETRDVPNLIAEFTSAAVRHMDLTTPKKVLAFLTSREDKDFDKLFVAVPMPPKPPYYGDVMDLHVEIDRGDVWYDYPFTEDGGRKSQPRKRMPKLTLFVKWNGQDIPLVSMGTTIGGWRSELAPDGYEYYKYKNSDVGPKVWKDIIAGPVWLPPDTTPVNDLVKTVTYRGRKVKVPNYDEFGPWYTSAYGLVAGFHVRPVERKNGTMDYLDNGIRSHGSFDYNSILRRFSHGCHRLYNHLAIRLFDFVLKHKKCTRIGQIPAGYSHQVQLEDGETYMIQLDSKGYRYELTDPLPVNVLTGNIRGRQRSPIEHYMPKPGVEYGEEAQFLPEGYKNRNAPDAGPLPQSSSAEEHTVKKEI